MVEDCPNPIQKIIVKYYYISISTVEHQFEISDATEMYKLSTIYEQ